MRQYLCSVKLGDSTQHVVTNKRVTVPEIAILRRLHGESAVTDIRPYTENGKPVGALRTDGEERERLAQRYNGRADTGNLVEILFGPMGALPKTLRDVGIDPATAAAEMRRKAEEMAKAAANLVDEDDVPLDEDDDVDAAFEAA